MPFALTFIGLLLVITGFQDTYKQMGSQVAKDFTGSGNFFYWIIAIGAVGALGYDKNFTPFSRAFMALIIVAMFLSKNNVGTAQGISFFTTINSAVSTGTSTAVDPAGGGANVSASSTGAQAAGTGSGLVGEFAAAAGPIADIASLF